MRNIQGQEHDYTSGNDEGCKPKWRPDSCLSWLVCAASTMSVLIVTGIGYSFGLMLTPLMDNFAGTRQATGNTIVCQTPTQTGRFLDQLQLGDEDNPPPLNFNLSDNDNEVTIPS